MAEKKSQEVALFPIPGCAVFPGTVFPLHVFEPRYRTMVKQCLDSNMPIAICHTKKVLHEVKPPPTQEEALQSNQTTYKPFSVFSAGLCEHVSTTNDGRLLVNVYVDRRLILLEEIQTLPFSIGLCDPYLDFILSPEEIAESELLKDKILHRLIAFSANDPQALQRLESEYWQSMPASAFSFEVFSIIRFDGDIQQAILEDRSALSRLQNILNVLNG